MFEHWCQLTYFSNHDSVFPSEELLDNLELYDSVPRNRAAKAFSDLVEDFNQFLIERGIFNWFITNCYQRITTNNDSALFY